MTTQTKTAYCPPASGAVAGYEVLLMLLSFVKFLHMPESEGRRTQSSRWSITPCVTPVKRASRFTENSLIRLRDDQSLWRLVPCGLDDAPASLGKLRTYPWLNLLSAWYGGWLMRKATPPSLAFIYLFVFTHNVEMSDRRFFCFSRADSLHLVVGLMLSFYPFPSSIGNIFDEISGRMGP
jgi:hypothetical protein